MCASASFAQYGNVIGSVVGKARNHLSSNANVAVPARDPISLGEDPDFPGAIINPINAFIEGSVGTIDSAGYGDFSVVKAAGIPRNVSDSNSFRARSQRQRHQAYR